MDEDTWQRTYTAFLKEIDFDPSFWSKEHRIFREAWKEFREDNKDAAAVYAALIRGHIRTIPDLHLAFTTGRLKLIRNIGEKREFLCQVFLERFGLPSNVE